jgi:hypothetical protein
MVAMMMMMMCISDDVSDENRFTTNIQQQQQQQQQQNQQPSHDSVTENDSKKALVSIRKRANPARIVTTGSNVGNYLALILIALLCPQTSASWGSGSSSVDYSLYGNSFTRDWLYDGSTLSFQVLGCVWGMVEDSEEAGCLEDESEDGTYNWYMMANCRRPQVAYSVFASSGCNSNYFVGSVGLMKEHQSSPSSNSYTCCCCCCCCCCILSTSS